MSKNDLEVALITPDDKNTVSKATYRKLLKKYNQQAEQLRLLRTQLEDKRLELEENSTEYAKLTSRIDSIQGLLNQYFDEKNRENTTKEIERIAEELTLTDYQSLEEEDAKIYNLMQEGDWPTLSAYLLKLMNGDAAAYVQEAIDQKNVATKVYNKASRELSRRLERIENAIESYKMQHLNDSVSNYYKILVGADSTNWEYLDAAGRFEHEYMSNEKTSLSYLLKALAYAKTDSLKAVSYNNIGIVYYTIGEYEQSLRNHQKALNIRKAIFGERHADVALSYNNIGSIYSTEGDNGLAMKYYQKACNIQSDNDKERNLDLAITLNNIGMVCNSLCKYDSALVYYNRALDIQMAALGEVHPSVASTYNNIGCLYSNQEIYAQAIDFFKRALEIQKRTLGERSLTTAATYNNLGYVYYCSQGNDSIAMEYFKKFLEIYREILGENHPSLVTGYLNVGFILCHQNKVQEALILYKMALDIQMRKYGESHPKTAAIFNNMGMAYFALGDYMKTLDYLQKSLDISINIFGKDHPDVISLQSDINIIKEKLGLPIVNNSLTE